MDRDMTRWTWSMYWTLYDRSCEVDGFDGVRQHAESSDRVRTN